MFGIYILPIQSSKEWQLFTHIDGNEDEARDAVDALAQHFADKIFCLRAVKDTDADILPRMTVTAIKP